MTTRARYENALLRYYESSTHETVKVMAPVWYEDDFNGDSIDALWTAIDVSAGGDTTPLLAADAGNGVLRLPLDATSEAQESGATWGDQRTLILNQGLNIEFRIALQTLPTLASEMVWGLAGDKNADPDTVAESLWFKADGSGAIVVENDDTVNTNDDIATGTTLTAGTFAVFRIDCSTITDCKFYINGARVAEATAFSMAQVAGLKLQPYVHVLKASGAGLGVVDVDYVKIWQKRS